MAYGILKESIKSARRGEIVRQRSDVEHAPDVTFLNLNLMLAAGADGTFDQQIYIPLGLLYMASVLRQRGGNVELIDYQLFSQARRFDVDGLTATIGQTAPIVGISWLRHSNVPTPHGE
jgi:hypothetical protein